LARFQIILILMLIISPLALSDESLTFKQGEDIALDIGISKNDLSDCDECSCYFTIFYQNGSAFTRKAQGTNVDSFCQYTNNTLKKIGIYGVQLDFNDSVDNGRTSFEFQITTSGRRGNDNIALFIILIAVIYTITLVSFFGKNIPLSVLTGMIMSFFGVWIVRNGIVIYRDNLTNYFGYVTMTIGSIIALWALIEWITDTF